MDRLDAMRIFVTAVDEGSLAGACRRLRRSPAAVSRAIAALEAHVGVPLLHRTTRSLRLSETGSLYAATCRQVLHDLDEADRLASGERTAPRGTLTITAPVVSGEDVLRPIVSAFLAAYPTVSVHLHLLDRPVNLIDEGIDLALRIADLPDSSMVAVRVGEVRRVIAAAPSYLADEPEIRDLSDLAQHRIVTMSHFGVDRWIFPATPGGRGTTTVTIVPRLVVNSVRAVVAAAVEGQGLIRVLSYQVAPDVEAGRLRLVLPEVDANAPLPAQIIMPAGRLPMPKVRAFVDFAVPRLRASFTARQLPA